MKKYFLIFVMIFFAGIAFAEPSLQEVGAALSQNKITRGDFSLERYSAKTNRALKSQGAFTIASEYGMIWFTQTPVKTTQAVTINFMITENARGKRTTVSSDENKIYLQMATLTSALFTNDLAAAEQNAQINFSCKGENWQIELFPRDASIKAMLQKIVVKGAYKNGVCVVTSLAMNFSDKSTATYLLSGHKFFNELSAEEKRLVELK